MEAGDLRSILENVKVGTKLRLTFKQANSRQRRGSTREKPQYFITEEMLDVLGDFRSLLGHTLLIRTSDELALMATLGDRCWEANESRVFEVIVQESFDAEVFEVLLADGLENLEII